MRKSKPKKRILLPDPKYHDVMVTRFVNNLMLQGKKSTGECDASGRGQESQDRRS